MTLWWSWWNDRQQQQQTGWMMGGQQACLVVGRCVGGRARAPSLSTQTRGTILLIVCGF